MSSEMESQYVISWIYFKYLTFHAIRLATCGKISPNAALVGWEVLVELAGMTQ